MLLLRGFRTRYTLKLSQKKPLLVKKLFYTSLVLTITNTTKKNYAIWCSRSEIMRVHKFRRFIFIYIEWYATCLFLKLYLYMSKKQIYFDQVGDDLAPLVSAKIYNFNISLRLRKTGLLTVWSFVWEQHMTEKTDGPVQNGTNGPFKYRGTVYIMG